MAITKQANCAFPKFIFTKRGAISPAAVIIATVDDPCMILTIAALIKANASTGNPASLNEVASNSPAPVVVKTCLKTPPAPVNKIIVPAGSNDLLVILNNFSLLKPLLIPKKYQAKIFAMINAENG